MEHVVYMICLKVGVGALQLRTVWNINVWRNAQGCYLFLTSRWDKAELLLLLEDAGLLLNIIKYIHYSPIIIVFLTLKCDNNKTFIARQV